jgi:transposase
VSTYGEVDTNEAGGKRRRWPEELKRELVAATFEPGASVSIVARRHDLNANQLFKWRRQFAGPMRSTAMELLPVQIGPASPTTSGPVVEPKRAASPTPQAGSIEVTLSGGVRVRVTGSVDPAAITAALGAVMKARRRR